MEADVKRLRTDIICDKLGIIWRDLMEPEGCLEIIESARRNGIYLTGCDSMMDDEDWSYRVAFDGCDGFGDTFVEAVVAALFAALKLD